MHAELLSPPVNFAVVQLPERKFPGVVCQGDTLFYLVSELTEFVHLLETGRLEDEQLEDIAIGLKSMRDQLGSVLTHYETVCNDRKITLPYSKE
jgi:hypothetical protein